MADDDSRLGLAVRALAFVLDLDVGQLNARTSLASIGADSVAIIACADMLDEELSEFGLGVLNDGALRRARTVGELAAALPALVATGDAR